MMRKLLLLALACAPIFLMAQAQRTALIEHFTNASCGPCASQNPTFNALIRANPDKVISIKYQANFPGFDPMNQQNPGEVSSRADYYDLSGVPTAWLDGFTGDNSYGGGIGAWNITATSGYAGGPYGHNQAVIDYAADQATPISMVLTNEFNEDFTELTVNVAITNESTEDFVMADGRLHVVLVERDIVFPAAPGNNGEFEFEDVMRKMYPNAQGTNLTTIAAGATYETTITGAVPSYIYALNEMRVIAFVQDNTSKEVWQATYTEPQEVANGVDAACGDNLTADPLGLCGATITPSVELRNSGAVDITQVTINALINGSVIGTIEYTETLAPDASTTITFPEIVLSNANNELTFSISEVNNGVGIEINSLNNSTPVVSYNALSETSIGTSLEEGNENYASLSYPETAIVSGTPPASSLLVVNRSVLTSAAGDPVGGFGESAQSIFVNFYQWNPAGAVVDDATLTYQKIDLTSATAPVLTFDRASASYASDPGGVSSDRLEVLISTDCAETFESVWDATGADLNTAAATNAFYIPAAGGWATETIDLSAYVGQEINVQFKAYSGWGNNLYLDNINVSDVVATQELTEVTEISLFPNPVKDLMKVNFELSETTQLQVEVFNATGQRVQQLGVANYGAGRNQIDIDAAQLSSGMYFLRMFNADRELSRRFIVQH